MNTKRSYILLVFITILTSLVLASRKEVIVKADSTAKPGSITIPFSWVLSDSEGKAAKDGIYTFTFALYDAKEGGNLLWSEQQSDIKINAGKVNVELGSVTPFPKDLLEEKDAQYWLSISVRNSTEKSFTALSPRQAILLSPQSPEALACPHNHFSDDWGGINAYYGLRVDNNGVGDGIRAFNQSTSDNYAALYGVNEGNGGSGVYGANIGTSGYGGYFTTQSTSGTSMGIYASSANGIGIKAVDGGTNNDNSFALIADGDIFTDDDLTVGDHLHVNGTSTFVGAKTGFVVDVAQNDDTIALEAGDVLVISGAGPAIIGEIPVIKVRRAAQSDSNSIVGVVDQHYTPAPKPIQSNGVEDTKTESVFTEESIQPGEYLTVVTLGAYKIIKVDASFGAIHPGDLLVSSTNPGYAMVNNAAKTGTVIGKALEGLASGTGMIAVLISFQ